MNKYNYYVGIKYADFFPLYRNVLQGFSVYQTLIIHKVDVVPVTVMVTLRHVTLRLEAVCLANITQWVTGVNAVHLVTMVMQLWERLMTADLASVRSLCLQISKIYTCILGLMLQLCAICNIIHVCILKYFA